MIALQQNSNEEINLNEILMTPSNVIIENRFSEEQGAADCSGKCSGVCHGRFV